MQISAKTLGFDVMVEVPDTVEELDAKLGRTGATLEAAIRHIQYHRWNPLFRPALAKALEKDSGIARAQLLDDNGVPVFEAPKEGEEQGQPKLVSEQIYINTVLADGYPQEDADRIAHEVAATLEFASPSSGRTKKPLAKHLQQADIFIAAINAGTKSEAEFRTRFEELNGVSFSTVDHGNFSRESLGLALRINEERKIAQAESDFA